MIGKAANVRRLAVTFAVGGSADCTPASAALTSASVWNMSTFHEKNRSISSDPRLVIDCTFSRPCTRVQRLFDRARHGDEHLIDRRDAVVDADQHARKIDLGKHRDRNRQREIDADGDERQDDEDDRLAVPRGPVLRGRHHFPPSAFSSLSPSSFSPGVDDADRRLVFEAEAADRHDALARLDAGDDLHDGRLPSRRSRPPCRARRSWRPPPSRSCRLRRSAGPPPLE